MKQVLGDGSDDEDESFKNPSIDDDMTDSAPPAGADAGANVNGTKHSNTSRSKRALDAPTGDSDRALPNGAAHANGTSDDAAEDGSGDGESSAKADSTPAMSDLEYLKSKSKAVANLDDEDDMNDAPPAASAATAMTDDDKQIEREHEQDEKDAAAASAGSNDATETTAPAAAAPGSKMRVNSDRMARIEALDRRDAERNAPTGDGKHSASDVADVSESGRLFIRNLSYMTTQQQLMDLFTKYGGVQEIHMPLDATTKQPKGFAYVLFMFPEHAVRAYAELDGTIFQGRLLHVLPSQARPDLPTKSNGGDSEDAPAKSSFKREQEEKKKASAQVTDNWNSFFMRSDTVADATAAKLNSK